jgi:GNAT superfamily N-acetyltransferase
LSPVELPCSIEPFDPDRHDRAGFRCGVAAVDNYFRKTANKLAEAGNVRLFVMVSADQALIGFYALNAHAVDYRDLPKRFARSRPGHGSIPAAFIAMIGRDQRYSGAGFGGDLLVDALRRIAQAADSLGIAVVLLDVLDCGDPQRTARRQALYESYGFQPLPSRPTRLFLPLNVIRGLMSSPGPTSAGPLPLGITALRAGEDVLLETNGSPLNRLPLKHYL